MRFALALSMMFIALLDAGTIGAQQAAAQWFTLDKLAPNVWGAIGAPLHAAINRTIGNARMAVASARRL